MSLLLFAALVALQPPAEAEPNTVAPVTVTAPRPDAALRELEDCIARRCPPAEEMRLTLRSAEESFLAGDYRTARATLRRSVGRNERHGDEHPVLVAGLHKANATVHQHLGFSGTVVDSASRVPHLLARRYGENSPEVLWARLDRADAVARDENYRSARNAYTRLQADARAAGVASVERAAEVRVAWLSAAEPGGVERAKKDLRRIAERSTDRAQAFAAKVLLLRLARRQEADAEVAALIADLQGVQAGAPVPVLLYDPPPEFDRSTETTNLLRSLGQPAPSAGDPTDWIDAGFWINADGRVTEAEVLRADKPGAKWHATVLDALRRRIYSPIRPTADDPQPRVYRIERLALTAIMLRPPTGSRLPVRQSRREVYAVDITKAAESAPEAPPAPK